MREQVSRFSLYSPLDSLLLEQSDEKMTDGGGSRSQLCSKVKSWGIFVCSRGKIYEDHLRRPRPNTYATGAPPLSIMAHGGNRRVARHGRCIAPRIMSYTRGRERERGRKNTSMGETCVARPITGEEIKKGEREREEGGAKKGKKRKEKRGRNEKVGAYVRGQRLVLVGGRVVAASARNGSIEERTGLAYLGEVLPLARRLSGMQRGGLRGPKKKSRAEERGEKKRREK